MQNLNSQKGGSLLIVISLLAVITIGLVTLRQVVTSTNKVVTEVKKDQQSQVLQRYVASNINCETTTENVSFAGGQQANNKNEGPLITSLFIDTEKDNPILLEIEKLLFGLRQEKEGFFLEVEGTKTITVCKNG